MVDQWLKSIQCWAQQAYAQSFHCIVCLQSSKRAYALCLQCEQSLPWLPEKKCLVCAHPLRDNATHPTCPRCFDHPPYYNYVQALFSYQKPIKAFIHLFKEKSQLYFGKILGELMIKHLKPITPIDCILPMPIHFMKQKKRGFNQSAELARWVKAKYGWPLDQSSCLRNKPQQEQRTLSMRERWQNLSDKSFSISKNFCARHVLIIEDVITTGTTINAFSKALKQTGVRTVEVWACCRALQNSP